MAIVWSIAGFVLCFCVTTTLVLVPPVEAATEEGSVAVRVFQVPGALGPLRNATSAARNALSTDRWIEYLSGNQHLGAYHPGYAHPRAVYRDFVPGRLPAPSMYDPYAVLKVVSIANVSQVATRQISVSLPGATAGSLVTEAGAQALGLDGDSTAIDELSPGRVVHVVAWFPSNPADVSVEVAGSDESVHFLDEHDLPLHREAQGREQDRRDRVLAASVGIVLLLVMLACSLYWPRPTEFQRHVFAALIALAGAAFATMLPGAIGVTLHPGISASGALAVFVLLYLVVPGRRKAKPGE